VGNSFALKDNKDEENVEHAITLYQLALENNPKEANLGLPTERIYNNLGMAYQYMYQNT
jgi:tetratricopeptide (TPR) repeat protein